MSTLMVVIEGGKVDLESERVRMVMLNLAELTRAARTCSPRLPAAWLVC